MEVKQIPSKLNRYLNLGNLPEIIFFGFIPSKCLNGDLERSTSKFTSTNIDEVNLSLNGSSVQDYPIKISNNYPILPYVKFLDVTRRFYDPSCSDVINMEEFRYCCIFGNSHNIFMFYYYKRLI